MKFWEKYFLWINIFLKESREFLEQLWVQTYFLNFMSFPFWGSKLRSSGPGEG